MEANTPAAPRTDRTATTHFAIGAGLGLAGVAVVETLIRSGVPPTSPIGWPGIAIVIATALAGLPGLVGASFVVGPYYALSLTLPERFPQFFSTPVTSISWLVVLVCVVAVVLVVRPRLVHAGRVEAELAAFKRYEKALRDGEARLRLVTDHVEAFIAYIDAGERYQLVNRAYEDWFGVPREQMIGRTVREVWGDTRYAMFRPNIQRALRGERVAYEYSFSEAGRKRHFFARYVPDVGPDGSALGCFIMSDDITELDAARHQTERPSGTNG